MITVFAVLTAKPGKKPQLIELSRANLANVRAEKGCHEYRLVQDIQGSNKPIGENAVAFVEVWQDQAALDAHLVTPHMKTYFSQAEALLASTDIHVLESAE